MTEKPTATLTAAEREERIRDLMRRELPRCVVILPLFERPDVFVPVENAVKTGLAPFRQRNGQLEPYSRKEFRALDLRWGKFVESCLPAVEELLALLEPRYYRDENGVITHGEILSESPLTASTILSPKFRERFADTMGSEFYVAVPERKRIVLIPKTTSILGALNALIVETYEIADYPASLELFELSKGNIRIVGKFGNP